MPVDPHVLQALLRQDFNAFVEKAFATVAPGQTFDPGWHLKAIGYQLEPLRNGEIKRLIINMPPRSLKSVTASVAFPAFVLGTIRPGALSACPIQAIWLRSTPTTSVPL